MMSGRSSQVSSTERQAGWVSGGTLGWCVRGRGKVAREGRGKAADRPGREGLASQERRYWSQCNGKAPLVPGSDRSCF